MQAGPTGALAQPHNPKHFARLLKQSPVFVVAGSTGRGQLERRQGAELHGTPQSWKREVGLLAAGSAGRRQQGHLWGAVLHGAAAMHGAAAAAAVMHDAAGRRQQRHLWAAVSHGAAAMNAAAAVMHDAAGSGQQGHLSCAVLHETLESWKREGGLLTAGSLLQELALVLETTSWKAGPNLEGLGLLTAGSLGICGCLLLLLLMMMLMLTRGWHELPDWVPVQGVPLGVPWPHAQERVQVCCC